MGLLVRSRPNVDVAEIVVLAQREWVGPRPGADDKVVSLLVALVGEPQRQSVSVLFSADTAHETRDDATARQIVERSEFFQNGDYW